MRTLILASRSPRRQQLLRQIGIPFEVRENHLDEELDRSRSPEENVLELSRHKAEAVGRTVAEGIVVGVDTIVVLDGAMLGKPKDAGEATEMLRLLSGKEHRVYTGFTLYEVPGGRTHRDFEVTAVKFRTLDDREIAEYVRSGSPLDKAGAYGIQDDRGALFVERINGCFYNVVGLPLTKFYTSLKQFTRTNDGTEGTSTHR